MIFKDNKPIFLQVSERLCDEILQGSYAENERVPSVREYSALVEVNINTAMRSFDYLLQLDILYTKRGLGYFVADGAVKKIIEFRHHRFVEEYLPDVFRQMKMLDISVDEVIELYRKF